jgi:hypothetical protein
MCVWAVHVCPCTVVVCFRRACCLCCVSLAGEVKYCVAKLFSNDVKFANITDY